MSPTFVFLLSTAGIFPLNVELNKFTKGLNYDFLRGLKYIAKNLTDRIESIAQQLANSDHDIITLQEIWVFAHYEHVRQSVSKCLPYSKFFYRYVFDFQSTPLRE